MASDRTRGKGDQALAQFAQKDCGVSLFGDIFPVIHMKATHPFMTDSSTHSKDFKDDEELKRFVYRQKPISARQSHVVGRVTTMTQKNRLTRNFINWRIPQTDKLNKLESLMNEQRRFGN
ncbi:hypothetical protein QYF61_014999 [Mycteria americana]|uniref:Uncharacterized protein n=1 Tax=Mycteria americana TaxID=33587 RepID=A0AAN7MZ28_MYCAM|nr:hypothetical protein QYF61_014999 [Mycteria americana]